MPRVTIGVPVYNAESLLEQCLANLAAQSFMDFKVIVLDNASTDETEAIARRFAAKDARFVYQRQPHNKGARQNFVDALGLADTPYFMWRADDDLSDVNFVEEMVRLLDGTPTAALAVGRSVLDKRGRKRLKLFPQRWPGEPDFLYRARLLVRSRSSWVFGLFRAEELRASLAKVNARYRPTNGFDHLIMFPFLATLRVVGSGNTSFITGYIERETSAKKGSFMDPREMQKLREEFLDYCQAELRVLLGNTTTALMTPVLWLYAERTYRWIKVMRARSRVLMGEKPFGVTTKYD